MMVMMTTAMVLMTSHPRAWPCEMHKHCRQKDSRRLEMTRIKYILGKDQWHSAEVVVFKSTLSSGLAPSVCLNDIGTLLCPRLRPGGT